MKGFAIKKERVYYLNETNMKKIINYILHPSQIKKRHFIRKMYGKYGQSLSDEEYISKIYKFRTGKSLNLENPSSFNEKMYWLKLNDRKPFYTLLCDKIEVKKIIEKELGPEYIVPTIDTWDSSDDIDFEKLPNKFVLKCNHDSGSVIVCRDKSKLNIKKTRKAINKCLKTDYFLKTREWPYKNINRKVFAEQYVESEDGTSMVDYKFFCFNGEPKFLYVSQGLENHQTASISFFDLDGNRLPFKRSDFKAIEHFEKPSNFEEMKKIAKTLAKLSQSKHVRIDLYSINNRIYFSEFTFFTCGGCIPFEPASADDEIGKMLKLD